MNVSDVVRGNTLYKKYAKARSVLASLRRRQHYYDRANISYDVRAVESVASELVQYMTRLDNNEFKSDTPRAVLIPVAQLLGEVYEGRPSVS